MKFIIIRTMMYNYHRLMLESLVEGPQSKKLREYHTKKLKHYAGLLLVVLLL